MTQTEKALQDFIKDNSYINLMIYFDDDWAKHFYNAFIEWLSNRYIVAKNNKHSNWFIFKLKVLDIINKKESIHDFLNQIEV